MTKRSVNPILIDALADGRSQREAARRAGVTERTVYNRLQEPEFQIALALRRAERDEASRARLIRGAEQAADNLIDVMENAKQPGARVRASVAVLDRVFPRGEPPVPPAPSIDNSDVVAEIERRLNEVEAESCTDSPTTSHSKPEQTGKNEIE